MIGAHRSVDLINHRCDIVVKTRFAVMDAVVLRASVVFCVVWFL